MVPAIVNKRIAIAEAVATRLRESATTWRDDSHSSSLRMIEGAQTITDLVELLKLVTFSAKLNQETIREMSR